MAAGATISKRYKEDGTEIATSTRRKAAEKNPRFSTRARPRGAIRRAAQNQWILMMLSHPGPEEAPEARALRGNIFTDLDRLAFALEMEASGLLQEGKVAEAERCTSERLGVRLAQRLVAGVWADEVDLRIQRWTEAYNQRLGKVA